MSCARAASLPAMKANRSSAVASSAVISSSTQGREVAEFARIGSRSERRERALRPESSAAERDPSTQVRRPLTSWNGSGAGVGVGCGTRVEVVAGVGVDLGTRVIVGAGVSVGTGANGDGMAAPGVGVEVALGRPLGISAGIGATVAVGRSVGVGRGVGDGETVAVGGGVGVTARFVSVGCTELNVGDCVGETRVECKQPGLLSSVASRQLKEA